MNQSYRQWLQGQANLGNATADALLQVVGDDGRVNDYFRSNGGMVGYGDPNNGGYQFGRDQLIGENQAYYDQYTGLHNDPNLPQIAAGGGGGGFSAPARNFALEQEQLATGGRQSLNDVTNAYTARNNKFATDFANSQEDINNQSVQNALNVRRSMSGIADGIRQGLRSGAVMLSKNNAVDSGASDALAYALSRQGNKQAGQVENEAGLVEQNLSTSQNRLNRSKDDWQAETDSWRDNEVNRVKTGLLSNLQAMRADGGNVNLGLADQLVAEAIAKLQGIDQQRQQRLSGARALTPEERAARAAQNDALGMGASPFSFDAAGINVNSLPGAQLNELPIFVKSRRQL